MWWNEFPDPNFIFLHVLHIDIPQRTSELCGPQISRWPPAAILDPELLSLFQNVYPSLNESLGSKVSNSSTKFRGSFNVCHIPGPILDYIFKTQPANCDFAFFEIFAHFIKISAIYEPKLLGFSFNVSKYPIWRHMYHFFHSIIFCLRTFLKCIIPPDYYKFVHIFAKIDPTVVISM